MIDGMSEICIDCVHQEVCRYDCHSPSEHCNDYAVADDFRAQGEWNYIQSGMCVCPFCGAMPHKLYKNFCAKCGADMRGIQSETRK